MSSRGLLGTVVATLLALSVALPAHAKPRAGHRTIQSITLTSAGSGTLIRITYTGRVHASVLLSRDPIDSLAVADVDNDGDLDILGAGRTGDLRLWRNSGHGRYVLAAAAISGRGTPAGQGLRAGGAGLDDEPEQAGDERNDAAMPRAPDLPPDPDHLSTLPAHVRSFGAVVPSFSFGRAPPARA